MFAQRPQGSLDVSELLIADISGQMAMTRIVAAGVFTDHSGKAVHPTLVPLKMTDGMRREGLVQLAGIPVHIFLVGVTVGGHPFSVRRKILPIGTILAVGPAGQFEQEHTQSLARGVFLQLLAQGLYALGLSLKASDAAAAAEHLQRAADVAAGAGNRWVQAFALTEVLCLEARYGSPRTALARFADVIDLWYRGGDWSNRWLSLRHVFGIHVQLRDHRAAATLHGALTAVGVAYALPFATSDAERIDESVNQLRDEMRSAEFATAVRRGASMTDGEIVEFVHERIRVLTS